MADKVAERFARFLERRMELPLKFTSGPVGARVLLIAAAVFCLVCPCPSLAQEGPNWLSPRLGQLRPRLSYDFTLRSEAGVDGQAEDLGLIEHDVSLSAPLYQDEANELSADISHRSQHFSGQAGLPGRGLDFPDHLFEASFGLTFRRALENGWLMGASAAFGSASDKPFDTGDENTLRAALFARIPDGGDNAWVVLLMYHNKSDFLAGWPIPGLGYWYQPGPRFTAVIGFPFFFLRYQPDRELTLTALYYPLRHGLVRLDWQAGRSVGLFVGFESRMEEYFLADRPDEDDSLFYYEFRGIGGLNLKLTSRVSLSLAAGWAFDRIYFQGEDYNDRNDLIRLDGGPFFSGGLRATF